MIGSILGQTEQQAAVVETAKASTLAEAKKRFAGGAGASIGMAIVFGAFELLHSDSHEAFPLLRAWGPWAIVTIVALFVIYDITKMFLGLAKRGVIAMENVAVGLQKIGDKDDRQLQEMQTLTAYTAQQGEKHGGMLRDIVSTLAVVVEKLDKISAGGTAK